MTGRYLGEIMTQLAEKYGFDTGKPTEVYQLIESNTSGL